MTLGDPSRRYPHISGELMDQLQTVEPSTDGLLEYRPCRVRLVDGSVVERVYVQEATAWGSIWGGRPDEDSGKREIPIEEVVEIFPSEVRLPARIANKLYRAGESGMGYYIFILVVRDGRHFVRGTGGAVDFVELPEWTAPADIIDVLPHEGYGDVWPGGGSDYAWCLYELRATE